MNDRLLTYAFTIDYFVALFFVYVKNASYATVHVTNLTEFSNNLLKCEDQIYSKLLSSIKVPTSSILLFEWKFSIHGLLTLISIPYRLEKKISLCKKYVKEKKMWNGILKKGERLPLKFAFETFFSFQRTTAQYYLVE